MVSGGRTVSVIAACSLIVRRVGELRRQPTLLRLCLCHVVDFLAAPRAPRLFVGDVSAGAGDPLAPGMAWTVATQLFPALERALRLLTRARWRRRWAVGACRLGRWEERRVGKECVSTGRYRW